MSSDPLHRQPVVAPTAPSAAETAPDAVDLLHQAIRVQLSARRRKIPPGPVPSLVLCGVTPSSTVLLRSAHERVADAVLGFEVGADVAGVLAIADSVVTTQSARFRSAHLAIGVWRDGTEVCRIGTDRGDLATSEPRGWLVDACRRAIGLTTAPTTAHPLELPLALWLDRLMVQVVRAARPVSWSNAVGLCPVPDASRSTDPGRLGGALASITDDWPGLRRSVASGMPGPVPIEPHHAAWMDDAMFARWCLGFFPDLDELRSDIEFLANAAVSDGVAATILAARRAFDASR